VQRGAHLAGELVEQRVRGDAALAVDRRTPELVSVDLARPSSACVSHLLETSGPGSLREFLPRETDEDTAAGVTGRVGDRYADQIRAFKEYAPSRTL
jgi:hypothetical protein